MANELIIKAVLDGKDVEIKLKGMQSELEKTGKVGETSFGGMSLKMVAGFAAAFYGVKKVYDLMGKLTALYVEQARAEEKVRTAIKSTGGVAGQSAEHLFEVAKALQEIAGIGDEKILNEVSAQLLTFSNITGERFERAQKAILDVATVLDNDLKGTAIQVGKALNEPEQALSALTRSGIQFTMEQKRMVKSLWDVGEQAKAQNIILGEIERQYGGQAEAAAKLRGEGVKLSNNIGDVSEKLGKMAKEALGPAKGELRQFVLAIDDYLTKKPSEKLEDERIAINGLVSSIISAGENQGIRNDLIKELNKQYPTFLKNLDTEKVTNEQLVITLKDYNSETIKRIELLAIQEEKDNAFAEATKLRIEQRKVLKLINSEYIRVAGDEANVTLSLADKIKYLNENAEQYAYSRYGVNTQEREGDVLLKRLNKTTEEYNNAQKEAGELLQELSDKQKEYGIDVETTGNLTGDAGKVVASSIEQIKMNLDELKAEYDRGTIDAQDYFNYLSYMLANTIKGSEQYLEIQKRIGDELTNQAKIRKDLQDKWIVDQTKVREEYRNIKAEFAQQEMDEIQSIADFEYQTNKTGFDAYIYLLNERLMTAKAMYGQESLAYKEAAEDIKQVEEQKRDMQMLTATSFVGLLQMMVTTFGSKSKQMFELGKQLATVQAIINTYQAATKALSEYPPPFGQIMAAIAVASGMVYVAQIQKQKFQGSGSGSGGTDKRSSYDADAKTTAMIEAGKTAEAEKNAKNETTKYAEGGLIDKPTLGILGEAGAEIIAPKKNFINVVNQMIAKGEIGGNNLGIQRELAGLRGDFKRLKIQNRIEGSALATIVELGQFENNLRSY